MGPCVSNLSLCNRLPKNLVTHNNKNYFLSHSYRGLGIWEQFSWAVLAQNLRGVALKTSGGPGVSLPGPGRYASNTAHLPGGQTVLIPGGRGGLSSSLHGLPYNMAAGFPQRKAPKSERAGWKLFVL